MYKREEKGLRDKKTEKGGMIRRLAACIREYKTATVFTPITITMEVILEVVIPLLMARLIDRGIEKGDMSEILKIGGILVGLCVLSLCFGALSGGLCARASAGFAKNLRHDMFNRVQNFSFANIDKFSTSSIITRMTTDVTNVQNSFQMIIRIAVRSPMMLIFALIMSFTLNAKLSLVFLGAVPILGIGLFLMMTRAFPVFGRVFKKYDILNRIVQENLRGVRVVKSFVRENHEIGKFNGASKEIYKDFTLAERILAFTSPLMQITIYGSILLISWFGANIIVKSGGSSMTTGELTSMISYASQILMSLMMVSMILVMVTISKASAERIVEVLNEESTITSPENPVGQVKDGSVSFRNVSFSYAQKADRNCLSDINIDIPSGATVGIIGATGSSKSTLVQLIPRLYDVTEGEVLVGGEDVRRYDLRVLRDSVAMVLQKNELFSGTVADNLRWGNENASDEEIVRACRLAQADSFIREFPEGYETHIEQGGANVSGGQKQRLCIARAILKKPKILILDDSTSAVDTATDGAIRRAFAEDIPHTTKLIIAQRISSVQHADMIIVMEGGRIYDVGNHEELLSRCEIYREVYESQTKGGEDDE